jgi:hypothetical protein
MIEHCWLCEDLVRECEGLCPCHNEPLIVPCSYVRDEACVVRRCYLTNGHEGEHANGYTRWKG